jgi:hypothetical protein
MKALAFNWDRCCDLGLCLWLIIFHDLVCIGLAFNAAIRCEEKVFVVFVFNNSFEVESFYFSCQQLSGKKKGNGG